MQRPDQFYGCRRSSNDLAVLDRNPEPNPLIKLWQTPFGLDRLTFPTLPHTTKVR